MASCQSVALAQVRWPRVRLLPKLTSAVWLAITMTVAEGVLPQAPPPTSRVLPVGGLVKDVEVITADSGGRSLSSLAGDDIPAACPPLLTPGVFISSLGLSRPLTDDIL